MNGEKLHHLIINTKTLGCPDPEDIVVYFNKELGNCTRVCLKNIAIKAITPWLLERQDKCLYVHCTLLNQDDNFLNGQQSDVLTVLYCLFKGGRHMVFQIGNTPTKIINGRTNCVRMYLTDDDNKIIKLAANYYMIYELEFS